MKKKFLDLNIVKLLYIKEHKSLTETAKILGCCVQTLQKCLNKNNIKQHSDYGGRRNYYLEKNYFQYIDTDEKAYFLGLLYADGNINKTLNTCSINLIEKDKLILEKFIKYLNFTGKLKYINLTEKGWNNQVNLTLSSKLFVSHLINKGCIPNKSLVLEFPTTKLVNNNFLSHFIRGYFDGDGCICIPKSRTSPILSITSTKQFCEHLQKYLLSLNIVGYVRKHSKQSNCYVFYMQKKEDIYKLYNYMYQDSKDLCLKRKQDIFIQLFN